jgi:4-hydroxy-tetrahydrodipicolinate synthase
MASALPRPLRGIVPPLVTPLRGPDELDAAGLERLVEHVLGGGIEAVFVLGTTGEGPNLSYRLRREVIDRTCAFVRGRAAVLVGVTDTSFAESANLARHAAEVGAAAVVASTPYYFRPGPPELFRLFRRLAEASPLPLFLYNMPAHTKVPLPVDLVRQTMELDNVVGVKDSSGDMGNFHALRQLLPARPDWSLLVGPEHLTGEAVLFGGHGGVNGGANLKPRLFVDLYDAATQRDVERVAVLQEKVLRLGRIYQVGKYESAVVKGLKCALACAGICEDVMAEPAERFEPSERERIRHLVEDLADLR